MKFSTPYSHVASLNRQSTNCQMAGQRSLRRRIPHSDRLNPKCLPGGLEGSLCYNNKMNCASCIGGNKDLQIHPDSGSTGTHFGVMGLVAWYETGGVLDTHLDNAQTILSVTASSLRPQPILWGYNLGSCGNSDQSSITSSLSVADRRSPITTTSHLHRTVRMPV